MRKHIKLQRIFIYNGVIYVIGRVKMKLISIRKTAVSVLVTLLFVSVVGVSIGAGNNHSLNQAESISDWYDLEDIRDDLSADYVLTDDLTEDIDGYSEFIDTDEGWYPIGNDTDPFTGTFDGNGYQIKDLYINRSEMDDVGLFGSIDGAEITDLGLVDADISGVSLVGGLVGSNSGTVENSYASGNVNGTGHSSGGLIGWNDGTVMNSFAASDLSGSIDVGGLIGSNDGMVENSYATGGVSGWSRVGGLIGYNDEGTVESSYAAGGVAGTTEGGLIGRNDATVSNSYWDIDTSGMNTSAGGTGLPTVEMTGGNAPNNLDGFDFVDTWETVNEGDDDADEDGYPVLQVISRKEQLEHVYPSEDEVEMPEIDIPGFTSILLLIATVAAVAIYGKKKQ